MHIPDLNRSTIDAVTRDLQARPFADYSVSGGDSGVSVYFRNLEAKLINHIRRAELVVGCVAWLTNARILAALADVPHGVAIVVQKEDFLRPDLRSGDGWPLKLREMYGRLKTVPERHTWPSWISGLSVACDPTIAPVRCVGNHYRDKQPAFPRMHHKFLVFCRCTEFDDGMSYEFRLDPYEVWTGSFNFTENAILSLENAVVVGDRKLAQAYFHEWEQVEAISEPLDWTSHWSAPEWRIGT